MAPVLRHRSPKWSLRKWRTWVRLRRIPVCCSMMARARLAERTGCFAKYSSSVSRLVERAFASEPVRLSDSEALPEARPLNAVPGVHRARQEIVRGAEDSSTDLPVSALCCSHFDFPWTPWTSHGKQTQHQVSQRDTVFYGTFVQSRDTRDRRMRYQLACMERSQLESSRTRSSCRKLY